MRDLIFQEMAEEWKTGAMAATVQWKVRTQAHSRSSSEYSGKQMSKSQGHSVDSMHGPGSSAKPVRSMNENERTDGKDNPS